jgi:mono/diheme cytochrome c family protein
MSARRLVVGEIGLTVLAVVGLRLCEPATAGDRTGRGATPAPAAPARGPATAAVDVAREAPSSGAATGRARAAPQPTTGGATAPPTPASAFPTAVIQVYRASCLQCHDSDGRGEVGRAALPKIPDFTDDRWQSSRSNAELSRSILEGKGKSMPRMKDKLGAVGVMQMVGFVRAFRGGELVVVDESDEPSAPGQPAPAADPGAPRPASPDPPPPDPKELSIREGRRLYQRSCAMCHGADGTGGAARDSLPAIPDFTVPSWHERRSDPQLVLSILDGKGSGMPTFRDKLAREQVRGLVTFVRAFGPPATAHAAPAAPDEFEARFRQLTAEFEDLRRQMRALAPPAPGPSPPATGPRRRPAMAGRP